MAEIRTQDPGSAEVESPLIAGLTEGLNKISKILNLKTSTASDVKLNNVSISETDKNRIYQATMGQRLWLAEPAPTFKKNDKTITQETAGFYIDYVGGSISFPEGYELEDNDVVTASFTYIIDESTEVESIRAGLTAATNQSNKYKGSYSNLSALQAAHATASNGDFAIVLDVGAVFIWKDTAWKNSQSIEDLTSYYKKTEVDNLLKAKEPVITAHGAATSDDDWYYSGRKSWINAKEKVRNTELTGLNTSSATTVTASDTVLSGIGKLQAQQTKSSEKEFISGNSEPNESTKGTVGQRYMNTSNGNWYTCIAVKDGKYTWQAGLQNYISKDVADSLYFKSMFGGTVKPDKNGDLDPSSPMFAGTGASITVRSAANRIENVTSHGSTEQAGTGDASPTNVRPITVGGLKLVEKVLNGSENWKKSTGVAGNAYYLSVSGIKQNGIIYSQHAKSATQSEVLASKEWKIALGSGFDYIRLSSPLESVSELKSHLKKNPLPAWYQPADESDATGIYTPQISDGESYHCECVELQQHLCEGDTVDSNVPSGCDKSAVFDGSPDEAWDISGSGANMLFYLRNALPGNSKTAVAALSNLYPNTGVFSGNTVEGFSGYDESLYVRDFRYSTVEDFKAALAANPLFVAYRSTEYTAKNDKKACMERHVKQLFTIDGTQGVNYNQAGYFTVALPRVATQNYPTIKCDKMRAAQGGTKPYCYITDSAGYLFVWPSEDMGITDAASAKAWFAENPTTVEYPIATPTIYAQPAVDLPADPITSTTQATLEEPAPDTPMLLAMQGETGTYTVSGEKTVSVYLKPMQDGGDAATLGGKTLSEITQPLTLQFNGSTNQTYDGTAAKTFNVTPTAIGALPADQPAASAPKSSKSTFIINYARITSQDNQGLYIRNAESEGSGVFVGVREGFQTLSPDTNTSGTPVNLGAPSYRWRTLYLQNQPDVSSDQNMKEQIEPLSEKQMLFFDALKPVQYKLKGSSHDRLHYGFIAQEVEQAMAAAGISDMEFGGFCKDRKIQVVRQYSEEGELIGEAEESMDGYEYSLRYGEFIALNTAAIQAMKKEILELKAEINKLKGV